MARRKRVAKKKFAQTLYITTSATDWVTGAGSLSEAVSNEVCGENEACDVAIYTLTEVKRFKLGVVEAK